MIDVCMIVKLHTSSGEHNLYKKCKLPVVLDKMSIHIVDNLEIHKWFVRCYPDDEECEITSEHLHATHRGQKITDEHIESMIKLGWQLC